MKRLAAICLLLSSPAIAEPIPARAPYWGESRPDWWWDIWLGRVVVLEGKIKFSLAEKPDIRITFNEERLNENIPDENDRKLNSMTSDYYVGEIEISKFLFADREASHLNGDLDRMRSGDAKHVKILIPILRVDDHAREIVNNLKPEIENVGIHVFDYTEFIHGINLSHSTTIPKENLADATEVFELREKSGHSGDTTSHPDRGYAGFDFHPEGDSIVINNVTPGAPANKSGLRDDDTILGVNGEKITISDLHNVVFQWRVGDQIELEVKRGEERHKVQLKLISDADLRELQKSEPGGADQPATAPELKLGGKEKPKPETERRPQ